MKRILILIAVFVILSCKTTQVQEVVEEKTEEKIEVKEDEVIEEKVEEIVEEKIEVKEEESVEEKIEEKIEEVAEEVVEEKEEIKEEICVVSKDAENRIPEPREDESVENIIEEIVAEDVPQEEKKPVLQKIDMTKWRYIVSDDVYFQVGIEYCAVPKDKTYEKIAIFVPGKYFDARKNSADFYTAKAKEEFSKVAYVMNTGKNHSALKASSIYEQKSKTFTSAGFIYVHAGSRADTLLDFKSAIRFVRYNADLLPGTTDDFFVFGTGGGGITAAKIALSGDEKIYDAELEELGAAQTSDSVKGVGAWFSIKNADFSESISESSSGNNEKNKSEENALLQNSLLQTSIDDFLSVTNFPYKADFSSDRLPEPARPGEFVASGGLLEGKVVKKPRRGIPNPNEENEYKKKKEKRDNELNGIFETPFDYVAALNHEAKKNGGTDWIFYDEATSSAKITDADGLGFFLNQNEAEDSVKKSAVNENAGEKNESVKSLFSIALSRKNAPDEKNADLWRIRFGLFERNINLSRQVEFVRLLRENGFDVDFGAVWQARNEVAESSGNTDENFALWLKEKMK
ncbi:MAG: hypothetical protein K6B43_14610 [Treponema sp.]|nr:hypothetical protein [Treponema sp.]